MNSGSIITKSFLSAVLSLFQGSHARTGREFLATPPKSGLKDYRFESDWIVTILTMGRGARPLSQFNLLIHRGVP
jgi:hypothetical protein